MLNCEILQTSLKATKYFVATAEISQSHCQALYNSYLSCCNRHLSNEDTSLSLYGVRNKDIWLLKSKGQVYHLPYDLN